MTPHPEKSLLLFNAALRTSDPQRPGAEAVRIADGRISWVGQSRDAPEADIRIDVGGRTVLPGLTDAHTHLLLIAMSRISLRTNHARSLDELLAVVAGETARKPDGHWIVTCDYNEQLLLETRHPLRHELDRVAPAHPVLLRRVGGHLAVANSAALTAAGIDDLVEDPEGGSFDREDGRLTGILREAAEYPVALAAPTPSPDILLAAIREVAEDYLAYGVVAAVDAAVGFTCGFEFEWDIWARARSAGPFPLRMGLMPNITAQQAAATGISPHRDRFWQCTSLKWFLDGIVGARTAFLSSPYSDAPGCGQLMKPAAKVTAEMTTAHRDGWQLATHAIGDRAIELVIETLEQAQRDNPRDDARHRIEHLGLPDPALFARLQDMGLVVVPQYGFLKNLGDSFHRALGTQRMAWAYPARSLFERGITIAGSSDSPIGPFSPLEGVASAMTRTTPQGLEIGPAERLSLDQSLECYTTGGAKAMFHEHFRGMIRPGMTADLAVLDNDLEAIPTSGIATSRAVLTLIEGTIRYSDGTLM